MFWKMLRSDLKKNKGLNVILFIFITVAFILSVVGVLQIYIHAHGVEYTMEQCKASDVMVFYRLPGDTRQEDIREIENWMGQQGEIEQHSVVEGIGLYTRDITLVASDVDVENVLANGMRVVMTQTMDMDLLYNTEDEPFYVENGTIALPVNVREWADLELGDKIRITSQMGYIYEFTIAHFYKTPSNMGIQGYILSPGDYQIFAGECPVKMDIFKVILSEEIAAQKFDARFPFKDKDGYLFRIVANLGTDLTYTISLMISYFVFAINVFVIFIMLLTIRFMLMASMKEEEKEIGMMRAIGVDSFQYRWLFVAKYIAFAFVGALIGVVAGMVLSKYQVNMFCQNTMQATFGIRLILSILAVCFMIIFIIVFTMLVMRRINGISVMDAVHGENKGERFRKLSKFVLYKSKKISVPSYLAVSDLLNSFKKYMVLIVTYSLGAMIVLCLFFLRTTLISKEYFKLFGDIRSDFSIAFPSETYEKLYQREGSAEGIYIALNQELADAGIPARIRYMYNSSAKLLCDDENDIACTITWGEIDNEEFFFRKGGTAPKLQNEVALTYYTARLNGLKVGDKITLEYDIYGKNRTEVRCVEGEFIITGFIDCMESGVGTMVLMGNEFDGAQRDGIWSCYHGIDGTEKEKAQYLQQMKKMYGKDVMLSHKERASREMNYVVEPLDTLKIVMSIVVLGIIVLMTILYASVLMYGENNAVAMLKCMGLDNLDIKKWQLLRIGMIVIIACGMGNILAQTLMEMLAAYVYEQNFKCSGFAFVINSLDAYFTVPVLILAAVSGTMLIRLKRVNKIEIWKIRED